eukprot:scaffold304260_cov146-Cyclotella_meneghiniana.AAC.1
MGSMNTSKANKVLLLPKILHLLYAEHKNKSIDAVKDDEDCKELSMIAVNYTTTMTTNQTQMMMHGALKHFHLGVMGESKYFEADNFNHLLVMSAAYFTMLIDGALDCYKEHAPGCVLREGTVSGEDCLRK